jgi:LPXTG-site transpeptidase (sortase) family protein
MRHIKAQFIIGVLLLLGGVFLLVAVIRDQRSSLVAPSPAQTAVLQRAAVPTAGTNGQPSELLLPSLNLDLSVIPGVYNPVTKTWTLSLDKVQYATTTPEPNTVGGNTFIYGHYRPGVFATLHAIQYGAPAIVKTSNGHTFYYQLVSERVTNPSDTSVFNYKGKPILTIQTCTGLFFQNRQLFTFDLTRVV